VAPAIKIPKPGKTGTPKGMEGVRPGSAQAIKAGYKPPKPPKPPARPGGARVPFAVSFNPDGTTTLKPPPAAPRAAAAPAAPPPPPLLLPRRPRHSIMRMRSLPIRATPPD
jgi:hypothetical protein